MPIHDFECESCGARFEELVKPGAGAACPDCGSERTRRLLSQVSPPQRIGLRGRAAKVSNETRRAREEQRREGWARKRDG